MTGKPTILVTGGCGYIGSHVCHQLSQAGHEVVVIDDLSTGFANNLLNNETLVRGDFGDRRLLSYVFSQFAVEAIFHFAASIVVDESVQNPLTYYQNNTVKFFSLLEETVAFRIPYFILSSTAAVYGMQNSLEPVHENTIPQPANPYGRSKLADEWMLEDVAKVNDLKHVTLRYFNVAGAGHEGRLGQKGDGSHLIKVACQTALKKRPHLTVFGTDYETPDGTCVRDYIHVEDLASAHLSALHYLRNDGESTLLNCGYKQGHSVKEVLSAFQDMLKTKLPIQYGNRRAGDVPFLIADNSKLISTLSWKPRFNNLSTILQSAYDWEKRL
ncbi:MAG: UDP-glucose 4-epimerase GalE [Deltaproteobacteria bacterium]|nr:UDP-glucose 4-epimerase GalE [Deltaproteobacteria bacterium]